MSEISTNKRIAKNTLYMYLRMIVVMIVSLFTTRIVFKALGIDDYGLYNVVGSIIVLFGFINSGLTTATRRYITAEIANGDKDSQQNVFNLSLCAHGLIAIIIFILAETAGLYLVNYTLNIPEDRLVAANVVYQMTVLTAIWNVFQAPFQAAITAFERMNIYAYLSILDVVLKLVIAYLISIYTGDKLIIYSILIFASTFLSTFVTRLYCIRKFDICRFKKPHNKKLLKEMFGYMGWSLIGQFVVVLTSQGVSMLVNVFFSVAANAAMGISNQITNVVHQFVSNFQVAFQPQITKQYVTRQYDSLNTLALRASRFSSYLVLIFLVPIAFQIDNFLCIWLGDYPEFAVEFCLLTLLCIFIDSISAPLWMIAFADNNIKKYQIIMACIYAFNFIGAWISLKIGFPPYSVIIVRLIVYCTAVIARVILVKEKMQEFSISKWCYECLLSTLKIVALPMIVMFALSRISINNEYVELFTMAGVACLLMLGSIYFLGLKKEERKYVSEICLNKIKNVKRNNK